MSTSPMRPTMPRKARLQHGYTGERGCSSEERQAELRLDDLAAKEAEKREAQRAANERQAARALGPVLRDALTRWPGGQEAYAYRLGIARPSLVAMCAGERPISSRDWYPLTEQADAWLVWTRGVASLGGMVVAVRRRPVVSACEVRDRIIARVLRDPSLRRIVLDDVAEDLGVDVEDLETALEVEDDEPAPMAHEEARP